MAILRHIAPLSAFKVGLIAYGFLGLLLGALCTVVAFAGLPIHAHMPLAGRIGVFAILICPMLYGLIGGIAVAIGAMIYNLASSWVGGIEVEIASV